jgi:minor extracellular serine protease Vpr
VVLYNNAPGRVSPTVAVVAGVADGQPVTIPVVAVSDAEGLAINNAIASGPQTLNWQATTINIPNATGGLISSFSSYGLTAELDLKPDIGAPGGLIRSTWPLEAGRYNTISGTSMASPHVAGAVALLLQAKPHTSSQAVRSILQNNAVPKPWWGAPSLGFLDNVHRQGAGMLRIDRAILATTSVTPGKLALGESQAGPATRTLTIQNDTGSEQTYTLGHSPALATGANTFTPSFFDAFATASFSSPSVVVPAGGTGTVDVTITAPAGLPDHGLYGGYITVTGATDTIRVPYSGFKGDYQSIQVLTPTASGLPLLSRTGAASGKVPPASSTFTMADAANMPKVLVHLDHQARRLRIEVQDTSGKSWHRALDLQYLSRNSTSTNFNAYTIDGTTIAGNKTYTLPNGTYTLTLSVQKALGGDADWETWTSPAFTIARP